MSSIEYITAPPKPMGVLVHCLTFAVCRPAEYLAIRLLSSVVGKRKPVSVVGKRKPVELFVSDKSLWYVVVDVKPLFEGRGGI